MIMKWIQRFVNENRIYKLASLGIAILLWLILLSRRDFEVTKNFDVEFRIKDQYIIKSSTPNQVKVHLLGSRAALQRVSDGTWSNSVVIDATNLVPGRYSLRIDRTKIDLPFGAKVIAVSPNSVTFEISDTPK
jgi:YbbR domain-containing protein